MTTTSRRPTTSSAVDEKVQSYIAVHLPFNRLDERRPAKV
jgi:hypothetical protein